MKNKNSKRGNKLQICFVLALAAVLVAAPFCLQAKVVIDEVQVAGSINSNEEFIELYNNGNEIVDLSDWSVQYRGGTANSYAKKNFPKGALICPGEHYLIGSKDFTELNEKFLLANAIGFFHNTFALSNTGGTIFLVEKQGNLEDEMVKSKIVDKVAYGSGTKLEFEVLPSLVPPKGKSIARACTDECVDTDNNNTDFVIGDPSPEHFLCVKEKEVSKEKEEPIEEVEIVLEKIQLGPITRDEHVYPKLFANFAVEKKEDEKVTWNFGDGHRSYKAITKHKYETAGAYAASVKVYRGKTNAVQNFVVTVEEYPRPKIRIVAINANPKGSDAKKETITLENKTKEKINLKGWSVATGWKKFVNHPIRENFEIKPGKKKELTRDKCAFTLVNDKNKIELRYPDGEVADEVKYKKPEGIKEGEIYEKKKRGWKWILPKNQELGIMNQEKKQKVKVDNKRNQSLGINNQSVESEKEMQNSENIGNQTMTIENAKVVILPENKIELAVTKINAESKVLSTQNLREDEAMYYFTSSIARQEHYMIVFLKKLNSRINMFLNYFLD